MSQQVFEQIQAIVADKSQLTVAQQKLGSGLLQASRVAKGQPAFPGADSSTQLAPNDIVDSSGNALVDIATTDATGLVVQIQALGGTVVSSFPQYNAVRASIAVTVLETLAGNPSVKSIRRAETPRTNRVVAPPRAPFAERLAIVRAQLEKAFSSETAQTQSGRGSTISEAVVAHGADIVQNAGITGSGVKVCVLSDGVTSLAGRQAAGELPMVQILATGQGTPSGDEGTAMLELVADMAPGASLGFSTGFGGKPQFAQNILDLRNVMGCDIIVDDLAYLDESAFQEDVIANAVTTVVNSGAMYFSSAANSGHLSGGQSGTWEGDFLDGGAVTGPIASAGGAGRFHTFGASLFNTLTEPTNYLTLKWSDPIGAATNDYDLVITNSTGTTVTGYGGAVQSGTQDPYELIVCSTPCPAGSRIYLLQFNGVARALRLDTNRGRLSIGTNGSSYGHNAGMNTTTVAAVSNNFAPISGRKFTSSDVIATYSSDGPRKLFLDPVPATTYITPGCALYGCGGGTLLPKVDIAAADCDATTTPGFQPFCGTSAAAPQAAAIAALIKSSPLAPGNAATLALMKSTAIDIMAPGSDVDTGAGIVMADAALMGSLTITSTPSGRSFAASGPNCATGNYTTPATLPAVRGGTCTISPTATQPGASGVQYVFASWSDNNSTSNPRAIGIPDVATSSINMAFATQYQLTVAVSPVNGGTAAPASGTYFNAGSIAPIAATPASGFQFGNWTGPVASTTSASSSVTMSAPRSVTANFTAVPGVIKQPSTTTLTVSPSVASPGQPLMATATVAGTGATGSVVFKDAQNVVATSALSGNSASATITLPLAGTHGLTAVYSGDAIFNGSTSAVANVLVHLPCSDAFASAVALPGSNGSMFGSTTNATGEPGEPNHAGNSTPLNSVWCKWTAPASGNVVFDTTGSGFDTTLAIYTGGVISTLIPVAANDNIAANNVQSRVSFAATAGTTYMVAVDGAGAATGSYVLNWAQAPGAQIFASLLPSARSVLTGNPATAFATIINAGTAAATDCSVAQPPGFPAAFNYQTTTPNNLLSGTPNTPATIAPGAAQSFMFAITPLQDLNAVDVGLLFGCANTLLTTSVSGLNTLLLSASSVPSPDLISIGVTTSNDGIVTVSTGSPAFFTAAAVNIGSAGTIIATIDDNNRNLPLTVTLCESNPGTGVCINPATAGPSTSKAFAASAITTYAVFVSATGAVPFDPANNRLFLRLKTPDNVTRGATSVAVKTQ